MVGRLCISPTSSLSVALATSIFAQFGPWHRAWLLPSWPRASSAGVGTSTEVPTEWFSSSCGLCAAADYSFGTDAPSGILEHMTVCEGAAWVPVRLQEKARDRPWREEHSGTQEVGEGCWKIRAALKERQGHV